MLKRYAGAVYAVALGLALALPLCLPVQAQQAQPRLVPIPAKAKRAKISFSGSNTVLVDGKQALLAPGARIFDSNNMLLMFASLNGTVVAKYTVEENTGLLMNVWVLTPEEVATPDPKPAS